MNVRKVIIWVWLIGLMLLIWALAWEMVRLVSALIDEVHNISTYLSCLR